MKKLENEAAVAESEAPPWAELVLPYLPPQSLATIAATSSSLRRLCLSITLQRSSDASRTFENHPIPFLSSLSPPNPPYSYFLYTPTSIPSPPSSSFPQPWPHLGSSSSKPVNPFPSFGSPCPCGSTCEPATCPCFECGPLCHCGSHCPNRSTQRPISLKLKIVRHPKKGWGLHTCERIKRSQFVCEYAGEYLTTEEARRRQRVYDERKTSAAMMVVREHLPSGKACLRVNIDATRIGNVGRFVNHACDGGNLVGVVVRGNGEVMPRLCFFARRAIGVEEELCISYGEGNGGRDCYCGTSFCRGKLPCEDT